MLTVLGIKPLLEDDKPWWKKESYVRGNEILKCLLEEYMKSGFLRKMGTTSTKNTSKGEYAIELDTNGITGKVYLENTVVGLL